MTREEAKYTLLHIYEQCAWGSECEEYGCSVCEDALNMAIEALSADRPTHERDLISRHEALMELNGAWERKM